MVKDTKTLWNSLQPVFSSNERKEVTSFLTYQIWWTCKGVRFPTSGLSVTEACGGKPVDGHVD